MLFMSANNSDAVVSAKNTLDQKIIKYKPTNVEETLPPYVEDMESSSNIKTICGKSPFTHLFMVFWRRHSVHNQEVGKK